MPAGAEPQTHLASGPWCFAGQEEAFPGWYGAAPAQSAGASDPPSGAGAAFPLPPDPYKNTAELTAAARAANGETLRLVRLFSQLLYGENADNDKAARDAQLIALGPFILLAVHMLAERQKRVLDLVRLHEHEPLRVEVLTKDSPFSFCSSLDFMLHGVQDVGFNHYVYSRIVESLAPPAWELVYLQGRPLHQAAQTPQSGLAARCKGQLRALLRDLPFPRLKGFSLWQALLLSLAVLSNTRRAPDASIDFSVYCDTPLIWRFPAEDLIMACLPRALRKPLLPAPSLPAKPGPLRCMSPAYSQDDTYRLRLAALKQRGCRLLAVQHGANYGNLASIGGLPFEYSQHVFCSWGWSSHANIPVNALPLPHPALCRIANSHKEESPRLILVGTEMSSYSYRLKSRPQAGALPAYREGKVRFLGLLRDFFRDRAASSPPAIPARLEYRPYFTVAGGLDDAKHVLRHVPDLHLCTGDLTAQMLSCRLLVLDHYGTTLHMALAANTPCLAFWNSKDWGMDEVSENSLNLLREAGLLHDTPERAAAQAISVWDQVEAWWRGPAVQTARQSWIASYADIGDTVGPALSMSALTRRWFTALRHC